MENPGQPAPMSAMVVPCKAETSGRLGMLIVAESLTDSTADLHE